MSTCNAAIKVICLTNLHDEFAAVGSPQYELSDICASFSDDRYTGQCPDEKK